MSHLEAAIQKTVVNTNEQVCCNLFMWRHLVDVVSCIPSTSNPTKPQIPQKPFPTEPQSYRTQKTESLTQPQTLNLETKNLHARFGAEPVFRVEPSPADNPERATSPLSRRRRPHRV